MTTLVSARRAAELLHVSEKTVRNRISAGTLRAERSDRGYLIAVEDLDVPEASVSMSADPHPRGTAPRDVAELELVRLLVDRVERLSRENQELRQQRAALVEQRDAALAAATMPKIALGAPTATSPAEPSNPPTETERPTPRPWWRRWLTAPSPAA